VGSSTSQTLQTSKACYREALLLLALSALIIIIIIIIFISINPVQSRMWKSQYKYKISSTEYDINIVIEASKYIKQSDVI
jgi:uncharacterized protein YpmS